MAFPFGVEHLVRPSPCLILAVFAVGVGIGNDVLEPRSVTVVAIR